MRVLGLHIVPVLHRPRQMTLQGTVRGVSSLEAIFGRYERYNVADFYTSLRLEMRSKNGAAMGRREYLYTRGPTKFGVWCLTLSKSAIIRSLMLWGGDSGSLWTTASLKMKERRDSKGLT